MSYTPPPGNAIRFNFSGEPNPTASPVLFKFGATEVAVRLSAHQLVAAATTASLVSITTLQAVQLVLAATPRAELTGLAQLASQQAPAAAVSALLHAVSSLRSVHAPCAALDAVLDAWVTLRAEQLVPPAGLLAYIGRPPPTALSAQQLVLPPLLEARIGQIALVHNSRTYVIRAERRGWAIPAENRVLEMEP